MSDQPVLRIVGGGVPTGEEIAALVTALSAAADSSPEPAGAASVQFRQWQRPGWTAYARRQATRRLG